MIISDRLQNRLSRCRKASLQNSIQSFVQTWGNGNCSAADCYNALRALCRTFDDVGEYHDAEEVMRAGQLVLEDEPRRRALAHQARNQRARNERNLLTVGGMVVGGLLLCALVKR
jgi:hypothetical protein